MNLKTIDELIPTEKLGFGNYYGKLMLEAHYKDGEWKPWTISNVHALELHPGAKALHYAQEIFEGLKAYKQDDGIFMFRPDANISRMSKSAEYLAMPPYPEDQFLEGIKLLVSKSKHLVPELPGSLYLRPTMIGRSANLGVAPSAEYMFYVLTSPVGGYFGDITSDKPACIDIWASDIHVRAVRGGLGAAKTGANYAASLRAVAEAKKRGFHNVLFLDAIERKNLEELSGMNVFVVEDGILKTPPLGDTILAGVTRDSLLKIAKQEGLAVKEEQIPIDRLLEGLATKRVTEVFACGTASVVTSIKRLGWLHESIDINGGEPGPVATKLYQTLTGIQSGKLTPVDPSWLVKC
ncbi:branched-chain amino acid aminotransferase [bacterium]|nr:branched-chain amino acid aminotransferase [bacterium]